jgi:cytoskeletal protein RodZ
METFGSVVRAARRHQGLSLAAPAEPASTTEAMLSDVENGREHADPDR